MPSCQAETTRKCNSACWVLLYEVLAACSKEIVKPVGQSESQKAMKTELGYQLDEPHLVSGKNQKTLKHASRK